MRHFHLAPLLVAVLLSPFVQARELKEALASVKLAPKMKETRKKVEFTQHPTYKALLAKGSFGPAKFDPFFFDRKTGNVPAQAFRQFETSSAPRDIYLFYKKTWVTSEASGSMSFFSFDPEQEGDSPSSCTECGALRYYRVQQSLNDEKFDIVAFHPKPGAKTVVYIFAH